MFWFRWASLSQQTSFVGNIKGLTVFCFAAPLQVIGRRDNLTKFVFFVSVGFGYNGQRPAVYLQECGTGISGGIARIASALPGILRSEEPGSSGMPSIRGISAEGLISSDYSTILLLLTGLFYCYKQLLNSSHLTAVLR